LCVASTFEKCIDGGGVVIGQFKTSSQDTNEER